MAGGGSKPGERRGGRKKGTPNKKAQDITMRLERLECDPVKYMVEIAREAMANKEYKLALEASKELMQYIAPKRKAIEVTDDNERPTREIEVRIIDNRTGEVLPTTIEQE